jgi:peptidylprolyl isomerase
MSTTSAETAAANHASIVNSETARYCYIDIDVDDHRSRLATAAAFVHATDTRYGFKSSDLRYLGGSEVKRIPEFMAMDHQWSGKVIKSSSVVQDGDDENDGVAVRPPASGHRIVVQLYWHVAPLACQNFAMLCANGSGGRQTAAAPPIGDCGKPLQYRGSLIHRVIPGFIVQGGDFVFGNGSGGESIYGGSQKKFKDERAGLCLKHNRRGILSMGNSGKNSNSSQFFITFAAAPQCDGKHVVFGHVVSGWPVLSAMEKVGTTSGGGGGGEPSCPITITDCGIWTPLETPAAGYWYDKPDPESYSGVSSLFIVRPRVAVLVPSAAVGQKFETVLTPTCVLVETVIAADNDATTTTGLETACKALTELLENFAIDVILVAPACSKDVMANNHALLPLPTSWSSSSGQQQQQQQKNLTFEQIVLVNVKPIDALKVVRTQSWLVQRKGSWHLDGVVD